MKAKLKVLFVGELEDDEAFSLMNEMGSNELLENPEDLHISEWAEAYGEPGYQDPELGILLGDWNRCPEVIADWLEEQGYELEWDDEWVVDTSDTPSLAYRCQPSGYSWTPSYILWEGEIWGRKAILKDPKPYLELLQNNPDMADTMDLDLASYGFEAQETSNSRWGSPSSETPTAQYEHFHKRFPDADIIFSLDSQEQFGATWTLWLRHPEDPDTIETQE